ncbi:MAG: A/G-specific adenine glycosylase [Xanthomonadales bacterium]|jgi:A/G-specific adenine glycosylase|nr:A/G-specific adenine glycosylase [Xanthomonadales bacterium]
MPRKRTPPFAQRLLAWWDQHGRHDLPWQHPRTPYRVWVSEIMLQQTQVGTVIPYFERWMRDFPDVPSLAAAPLDDVLSHWSGLGYYARARNLHSAAIQCMEEHGGNLPRGAEALSALPGIGLSTANAIVSQSTDLPAAVLDGNVRRVLARHAAVEGWTGQATVQKRLWMEAENRLPAERGADYTQAAMDLGAMLCTRSKPGCGHCPVRADCQARLRGLVGQLPTPKPATKVSDKTVHMLILRDSEGRVLLERRPPAGVWGGLWCLPDGDSIEAIERRLGSAVTQASPLPGLEHRLSHIRMTICPALADAVKPTQVQCPASRGWFERRQLPQLGLPKPVTDLLNRLHDGEFD